MWSHRFWKQGGEKKPPLPLTVCLQLYQPSPGCGRALLLHGHTTNCCARAQVFLDIRSGPVPATDYVQIGQGLTSPVGNAKAFHRISWGWHKTLRAHSCSTECWLENGSANKKLQNVVSVMDVCEVNWDGRRKSVNCTWRPYVLKKTPKNHQTRNVIVHIWTPNKLRKRCPLS